jgi:hypothetical protein
MNPLIPLMHKFMTKPPAKPRAYCAYSAYTYLLVHMCAHAHVMGKFETSISGISAISTRVPRVFCPSFGRKRHKRKPAITSHRHQRPDITACLAHITQVTGSPHNTDEVRTLVGGYATPRHGSFQDILPTGNSNRAISLVSQSLN